MYCLSLEVDGGEKEEFVDCLCSDRDITMWPLQASPWPFEMARMLVLNSSSVIWDFLSLVVCGLAGI